jgi:hypothetical protein
MGNLTLAQLQGVIQKRRDAGASHNTLCVSVCLSAAAVGAGSRKLPRTQTVIRPSVGQHQKEISMKLTDQELRKLRDAYNVQKKTQARRKPDPNGHRIQVTTTFGEWLQLWIDSGKLHLRGNGRGKFCMARRDDLGDYAVGDVEIRRVKKTAERPSSVDIIRAARATR